MAPGVDSASNRNVYRKCFWRVKCGQHIRLTTYQAWVMMTDDECGAVGGILGRGN
jgi:hypothetical protein